MKRPCPAPNQKKEFYHDPPQNTGKINSIKTEEIKWEVEFWKSE